MVDLNDGVAPTRLHDYLCQLAPQVAFDERELQNILNWPVFRWEKHLGQQIQFHSIRLCMKAVLIQSRLCP